MIVLLISEIRHKREEVKEDLTEEDLDNIIDIELSETETMWLLDLPSICVSHDSDEAPAVRDQNDRYQQVGLHISFHNNICQIKFFVGQARQTWLKFLTDNCHIKKYLGLRYIFCYILANILETTTLI